MSLHQSGQWRCNKGWNQWIQQQTANHSSVCCITELWFFSPFSRCIRTKQWNAIQITHFHQTGTFPTPLLTGQRGDNVGVYQQYYCSIYIKKKQELGLPDNHQGLIIYIWWIQRKNYSQCSCTIKATPFWHHSTPTALIVCNFLMWVCGQNLPKGELLSVVYSANPPTIGAGYKARQTPA